MGDNMTDEYGMTKFDHEFFKRAITAVLIIAFVATMATIYLNNRWKHDLDVRYIGFGGSRDMEYREYEITNKTKRTLKNATIAFKVDNFGYGYDDFTFKETINWSGKMQPGETVDVKLYWNMVKAEAKEHGTELLMADVEIKKITYK